MTDPLDDEDNLDPLPDEDEPETDSEMPDVLLDEIPDEDDEDDYSSCDGDDEE